MIVMYDTVTVSTVPSVASTSHEAVAGYIDGIFNDFGELVRAFPGARHLSIAVTSRDDADCLDVEPGDATNATAPAWTARQLRRGLHRPVLYTSVSNGIALLDALGRAGIRREQVRLWTAHYTDRPHLCGPQCGFGNLEADATQWTDHALGRNLDESLCLDSFFAPAPPADPHRYLWFPNDLRELYGRRLNERAVVMEYDRLRRHPFRHRPRLRVLRDALAQLAGRLLTVMEESGDTHSFHREWRFHQLDRRAAGQRLA